MEILPVESLSETDKVVFGINLYNLSVLKRLDYPILPGIVISPPEIILQTVLKYIQGTCKEVFEQKLTIIRNEIAKISLPQKLESKLPEGQFYFLNGEIYKKKGSLWISLLGLWLNEIRGKIWNMGLGPGIAKNLTPQAVFFLKSNFEPGQAFFDPLKDEVMITFQSKLSPFSLHKIDQMVTGGNKKLFIPQIFKLLKIDDGIKLVGICPFTQSVPLSKSEDIFIPQTHQKKIIKSAIKLFLNLANGFAIDPDIDGLLIEGEDSGDFDELVFRLCEGALSYPSKSVIYKLTDVDDGELTGTLRLLHRKEELNKACEALLFVRNKKNLLNVEIAIPKVTSVDQLLQIKRELNCKGISRKGTLKFWLEMSVPENIINIEGYLEAGIDGIILDLDYLERLLIETRINQPDLAKNNTQTIIKFLDPVFKILHLEQIPIIAKGSLILHPDILDFLIEKGCFGIIANTLSETANLQEHLSWMENRMVQKRTL